MSDRLKPALKAACVCLAIVLTTQLLGLFRGGASIAELRVPEIKIAAAEKDLEPAAKPGTPTPGFPGRMPPGMNLPPGMTPPPGMAMMLGGMPGMPAGSAGSGPPMKPELQARVDTILNSQIFGAIPKPPPMALQGIAGDSVLLRSPNGQTGLISVGGELGGVKLLKIGINRVLIEHDGQEKELTLFSGYGGDSLLNQTKEPRK